MEIVNNSFMPGDPRLIQQLVYELKSQGIFDQFRKECIADVDTKPAYQNLRQRVEGSVTSFLSQQTWRPDMNKNQVREQLRKNIYASGYLEAGVERIVDQVVNPKINTVFLPQVEEVVYRYLGIEKPNRSEVKKELKIDVTDLLPTDLEAVSPESDHSDGRNEDFTLNSLNTDSKLEEDESPPFEPIEVEQDFVQHEENSVDSHLSGFSGLQSHDSNPYNESKMEISNQDSQISQNSSESHLSIITSDENTKMDICEDSESKLIKPSDSELKMEIPVDSVNYSDQSCVQKDGEIKKMDKPDQNRKEDKKTDQKKYEEKNNVEKKHEEKKLDEKKYEKKGDDKKSRSSDKYSSKDKKDKHRKSSSGSSNVSSNKDKDKSSSKYTSSSSSKEKDKSKDKKEGKNSSSSSKEKVRSEKEKSEKERSDKDKEKSDRDRNKSSSGNSSRHSSGNNKEKERTSKSSAKDKESCSKDKESSSRDKESCSKDKDKEKSRASSSSTSRDSKSKSGHGDTKSKSSLDKHKKSDKASHNGRPSSSASSSTKRDKDKDKKRESKKESKDDHYSAKEKKNNRRSTDRDSNDGHSSKPSQSNSLLGNSLSRSQKISQESPNLNGGTGSGDSGSLDNVEQSSVVSYMQISETTKNKEIIICADVHKFKYVKPKFASNFEEARKLMKIRKQLARLEKQNQLRLAQIDIPELPLINGINCEQKYNTDKVHQSKETMELDDSSEGSKTPEKKDAAISSNKTTPVLQSKDLSKESWEALEARLAQEMSNVNYDSYESPYDDYDCTGYNSVVLSPRKKICFADEKHVSPKKFFFKTENNYMDEKQTTQKGLKTEKDTTDEIHIGMQEKIADMVENKGQEYKNESNMETDTKLSEMIQPTKDEYENTTDSSIKTDEDQKTTKDALVKMVTPSEIENKKVKLLTEVERDKNETTIKMENSIEVNIGKINVPSTESEVQKESTKKVDINLEVKNNVLDKNQTVFEESVLRNQDGPKKNEMKDKPLVISNTKKSMESIECPNVIVNKSLLDKGITKNLQIILRNEEGLKIGYDNDEECRYLEKPSPSSDRRLQFIFNYVEKLEETLKQPLHKKSQNQIVPSRRGRKRKLEENVDLKNNNNASYEQTIGIKKRKRCIAPNPNLVIAKATKEKLCNNTDISPNGSFSLPLSPAESDKSVDKKEEELPKLTKQKKNVIMRNTNRCQRYTSDDLYKPRLIFTSTRRNRGAKNPGD